MVLDGVARAAGVVPARAMMMAAVTPTRVQVAEVNSG